MTATILIASDSFKNGCTSRDACAAIAKGIKARMPDSAIIQFPIADGGEGTAEILTELHGGWLKKMEVCDPLMRPVTANYGISADGVTAYVELAQASGIQLLRRGERNPSKTTSYGTGEILLDAVRNGARNIILGIGSSATNDCGIGMAAALGYEFYDACGGVLAPVGAHLIHIAEISSKNLKINPDDITLTVLCDVDNPLYGPHGAAYTYAPQKGADSRMVQELDKGLRHFSTILKKQFQRDVSAIPGSGAAGGMGAATLVFLGATLVRGIETVMDIGNFDSLLAQCDVVITGEGTIDQQTKYGKVVKGIAHRAAGYQKPVVAFCGQLALDEAAFGDLGIQAAIPIARPENTLEENLEQTTDLLQEAAMRWAKAWKAKTKK